MLFKNKIAALLAFLFCFSFVSNSYALIAFVRDGNIHTMDDLGLFSVQITDSGMDSSPDVSPDGSKIVFQRNNSIYVMQSSGTDVVQLTSDNKTDQYPVWNGDGTKIAFESNRLVDYTYPHQMDSDGQNLVIFPEPLQYGSWHELAYNPNGNRIALIFHELYHTSHDLWTAGTPGNPCERRLIEGNYNNSASDPDFSPSGNLLVFNEFSAVSTIYIRDNGGEPESTRTQLAYNGTDPYFMSETRIVYVNDDSGLETICMVNTDNSSFVDTGIAGRQPSWGPGFPQVNLCPIEQLYGEKASETILLRAFRDSVLDQSALGNEITALYYQWSPVINALIFKSDAAKSFFKNTVDQLLEQLE